MNVTNRLVQIWLNDADITRECIPCCICGDPTFMRGTKLCNGCFEVESRLKSFLQCKNAIQFVQNTLTEVMKGASELKGANNE